jgi:hypothetical protein
MGFFCISKAEPAVIEHGPFVAAAAYRAALRGFRHPAARKMARKIELAWFIAIWLNCAAWSAGREARLHGRQGCPLLRHFGATFSFIGRGAFAMLTPWDF